ncbi:MAG: 50S ribosomal protein L10 [Candidatus Omnitrophica bacterium]|nr:50S ribosomal protein L10 [Candidatus Omnitrophota bacterium]
MTQKIGEIYRNLVSLDIKRRLTHSQDVFLLNYHKMTSAEMTQLRKNLKTVGASILVAKNSFMRKIFEEAGKPGDVLTFVDGPTAMVFVKEDPIATSRVLVSFAKEHEALKLCGGFMSDRVLSKNDLQFISKLPSRQGLYQHVASALNAPISKLAMSLNQIITKLAYALNAVRDKKG